MEFKDWSPVIAAVITGVISNLLTNYLTSKRTVKEIKMKNYMSQLEKVYAPIVALIDSEILPGDGYEGLTAKQINEIEKVINDNFFLVDTKLYSLVWSLREEMFYDSHDDTTYEKLYDLDGKFQYYVSKRYHFLRKKLYLNYDKSYFGLRRIIRVLKENYHKFLIRNGKKIMRIKKMFLRK